jgi:predicted lipid-binding transport protein (Tim44 family)
MNRIGEWLRTRLRQMRLGAGVGKSAFIVLAVGIAALVGADAWARVGGGQSYSGGHASGGHSGDGGSDAGSIMFVIRLVLDLLDLCFRYPAIGLPLLAVVVAGVVYYFVARGRSDAAALPQWTPPVHPTAADRGGVRAALARLRAEDPNFSDILFLDFVQMIYARYEEARGAGGDPETLQPYLPADLLDALRAERQAERVVEGVIVGSSEIADARQAGDSWEIEVGAETNYIERPAGVRDGLAWWTRTSLTFRRKAGVKSKGPEFTRSLNCPSCGSPVKIDASGACAYCGVVVKPGEFAWRLANLTEHEKLPRLEVRLELGGAETGVRRPTIFDPELANEREKFAAAYPDFNWDKFQARVAEAFLALQKAWSDRSWEEARAFETDRLFQTHLFWIQRYLDNGCANKLENVQIEKIEIVRVARDPYFDLITARIWASMLDYTIDDKGKLLEGDRKRPRRFTEYWTFIRKSGFKDKAAGAAGEPATRSCPSCGAPLKVSMSGVCEFCGSHVAGGDFDWTLAKIEQDAAYTGG